MQEQLIVNSKELDYDEDDYTLYEGKPFTGIEHWFYETGELGSEISYLDGMQDGWTRGWYKNGQINEETFYRKGCVKGMNKEWYENGQMKVEGEIIDGQSLWKKEWDESGNLTREKKPQ